MSKMNELKVLARPPVRIKDINKGIKEIRNFFGKNVGTATWLYYYNTQMKCTNT